MSLRKHLVETYLSIDPRTLGLFRICFGTVLLLNLWLRFQVVEHFYSNEGLLPNHTLLWAPPTKRMFSFFFTLSSPAEAAFGMAVCALVFAGLLVGYRTRLMQVLTLLCLVSLNTRVAVLENGGDMVMNILATFTVFLPLGKRFSIDSLRESLTRRVEHRPSELADRVAMRAEPLPIKSLAVLALILQLAVIYYFNVVHKTGATWRDATAVHLTLHQDRLITWLGVWIRENVPFEGLKALVYVTLVVETIGAAFVISPIYPVWTRLIAIALLPGLHIGFAMCLNLGPFSYAMAIFFALMVHRRHWEMLGPFVQRLHTKRVVWFDTDCGICFLLARVLARLDVLERLELRGNDEPLPEGVAPARAEQTLIVQNTKSGRIYERAASVAEILKALPFGFIPAAVLRVPGLHLLWNWLYDRVAQNRTAVSQWFGLAACGVPSAEPVASAALDVTPNGPARLWQRTRPVLRELSVLIVIAACAGELLNANAAVPRALRVKQPEALRAVVDYVRLYQGWRMFAPEAPPSDYNISVEATTIDGRLVDPYNEVASRYAKPPFTSIPPRLGQDQYFTTYSLFGPEPRFRAYMTAFEEWVLRYHQRTGNPKDRIVRFIAYKLSDDSPKPGDKTPTNFKRVEFLRYPKARR